MTHHGVMRWVLALLLLVCACTPDADPSASPSGTSSPAPGATAEPAPPTQLPAAEPQLPTLAAFRRRAAQSCATASIAIAAAPLTGDPLLPNAPRRHVAAAVTHYRAAAAAWTAAANDLWDFGLPSQRVARSLVTSLDTVAQYSHQTAELLAARDREGAQSGLSAVDAALKDTNRVARRLGIGRIDECGTGSGKLPGAHRVQVNALDFSFVAATPRRGPNRFVLHNAGSEPHHLFVVPLREEGTLDDALRADRFTSRPGRFLRGAGAVSPVAAPGETVTIDMRLRPGVYGLLCFVASEDGTPHAYKGMASEIVVP